MTEWADPTMRSLGGWFMIVGIVYFVAQIIDVIRWWSKE